MKKISTSLEGVFILEPPKREDERGYLYEPFNTTTFAELGLETLFEEDIHSYSKKNVLRGLHFQLPPKALTRVVRCTRGRIWDVAVDLRKNSLTYLKWCAAELSQENKRMLYIPGPFAHGFYALEDCEMLYKFSVIRDKDCEAGIAWNDPDININWPIPAGSLPITSRRDQSLPRVAVLTLPF